jgi:hypothetical protein
MSERLTEPAELLLREEAFTPLLGIELDPASRVLL